MSETYSRSPGIRLTAGAAPVGGVFELQCPALDTELMDITPLNGGWRAVRPERRAVGELKAAMLLKAGDAGQAALLAAYRQAAALTLALDLPGGQRLSWHGYVRALALKKAHPDAPVILEAAIHATGAGEVSA